VSTPPAGAPRAIRAFVALPVGDRIRARIAETVDSLRAGIGGIRWVDDAGAHLTLRFLGWASLERLRALAAPLGRAAAACPAGEAGFAGLGTFPERGSPRVLWLGVTLRHELETLQEACEAAAVGAGFEPETRPFRAHVTLGRWRERARRPRLPEIDLGAALLDRLVLFRSELKPSGAVYTPLETFALGG
jgi:2'-5' RNA ligase